MDGRQGSAPAGRCEVAVVALADRVDEGAELGRIRLPLEMTGVPWGTAAVRPRRRAAADGQIDRDAAVQGGLQDPVVDRPVVVRIVRVDRVKPGGAGERRDAIPG